MLFPGAEATLQASGPFPGEGGTKLLSLVLVSGRPSLSNEGGVNPAVSCSIYGWRWWREWHRPPRL